jgi:hypothetical protein
MSQRLIELVFAAGLFLVSIWFWWMAEAFPDSRRYAAIDTDYWPKITFGLMAVTSGLMVIGQLLSVLRDRRNGVPTASGRMKADWGALGRMLVFGLLVFAYFLAFGRVGFVLSTVVFLWVAAFLLPTGRPVTKLLFAPVFTIALTLLFSQVLGLPLPRGIGVFHDLSLLFY